MRNYLRERLHVFGINIVELSLTDFEFSAEFNRAIESKQTAEQKVTSARAEAEACNGR